jgi:hypothetical protein
VSDENSNGSIFHIELTSGKSIIGFLHKNNTETKPFIPYFIQLPVEVKEIFKEDGTKVSMMFDYIDYKLHDTVPLTASSIVSFIQLSPEGERNYVSFISDKESSDIDDANEEVPSEDEVIH